MSKKILIVTESDDDHAHLITEEMDRQGVDWSWLSTDTLLYDRSTWCIYDDGINHGKWFIDNPHAIWYRKRHSPNKLVILPEEQYANLESEGILSALMLTYQPNKWVNHPARNHVARQKPYQLLLAKQLGFDIPRTIISNSESEVARFIGSCPAGCVVKPISAHVIHQIDHAFVIGTRKAKLNEVMDIVAGGAAMIQERQLMLFEVRVIVMGKKLFAFQMSSLKNYDDIKQLEDNDITYARYDLSPEISSKILNLTQSLELPFAAIDFIVTQSQEIKFLEVNPNGQ